MLADNGMRYGPGADGMPSAEEAGKSFAREVMAQRPAARSALRHAHSHVIEAHDVLQAAAELLPAHPELHERAERLRVEALALAHAIEEARRAPR